MGTAETCEDLRIVEKGLRCRHAGGNLTKRRARFRDGSKKKGSRELAFPVSVL